MTSNIFFRIILAIIVSSIYYNWKFRKIREVNKILLEGLKIECKYSMNLENGKEKLLNDLIGNELAWKKFKKHFKIKI